MPWIKRLPMFLSGGNKKMSLSWLTNSVQMRGGGAAGSHPMSAAVHRSPINLWRSYSIFNDFVLIDRLRWMWTSQVSLTQQWRVGRGLRYRKRRLLVPAPPNQSPRYLCRLLILVVLFIVLIKGKAAQAWEFWFRVSPSKSVRLGNLGTGRKNSFVTFDALF